MQHKTVAYYVGVDADDASILACAETACNHNIHLNCVLIADLPNLPYLKYGSNRFVEAGLPSNWLDVLNGKNAALKSRATEVEALLVGQGVSANVIAFMGSGAELKHLVAGQANRSDIAFLDAELRKDPDLFHKIAYGVLFHSPVGLMINGDPFAQRDCIFLAWNDSLPASRVAHLALPILLAANEVVIGCFDLPSPDDVEGQAPGTDLAGWLSHHGCTVTVSQFRCGGNSIEHCIQERARELGADLVVMGAYGHSHLRQSVFGGTTQAMLEQTRLPVLFGH
ncbi:universal stress protein [Ruegeria arenilitoris]|uniref:Universal stress protein family protein n=1 Tax=Ruegeria arenilitoris TaxID=1173585 RepID=A0A238L138_9RHOB|nr:universal stress protein [Ruegeria arenilitoris]SMX48531.1 Universal stress protein family protein [Ruegeria arenilitoris]